MSSHFLFWTILLSILLATFCTALDSDVTTPMEPNGEKSIHPFSDALHDGRPKRHRPFLAGLVVGAALRRPHYGGYGGYYGGHGGYGGYGGYGGHGGYGGYGNHYYYG